MRRRNVGVWVKINAKIAKRTKVEVWGDKICGLGLLPFLSNIQKYFLEEEEEYQ